MNRGFFRFFNRIHIFVYRLTAGRFGGRIQGLQVLLLTTTGRRTRRQRTVPLGTFRDGEAYVIVASNAGLDSHPGWFINLRHDPSVQIQMGGKSMPAEARVAEGGERDRLWSRLISLSPGYADYERRTKRVIPLVALHPAT